MATNTTNLGLVKPALDDYYDVNDFNKNMDTIDTAIQDLRDESASSIQSTGGTMTGPLEIETNGEGLALKGEGISYTSLYPEGETAGRKGYYGFGETGNHDFLIANEYPDGDITFRQKRESQDVDVTLDSILNAESISNVMKPKAVPQGVTDLNLITETGFYEVYGDTFTNTPEVLTADGGQNYFEGYVLEVYTLPNGIILQRATETNGNGSLYRVKPGTSGAWSAWIGQSSSGGTNPDMEAHIANNDIHVTAQEKQQWNDKLSNNDPRANQLKTTDKTIIGSINELFQYVSNGKAGLATVIGGVATTASFDELKSKIEQDKQAAITILQQKGAQVSPDATLEQIVASISQTGAGYATGSGTYQGSGSAYSATVTVRNLSFTPKVVIVHVDGVAIPAVITANNGSSGFTAFRCYYDSNMGTYEARRDISGGQIYTDGFNMSIYAQTNTISHSFNYTWQAFA